MPHTAGACAVRCDRRVVQRALCQLAAALADLDLGERAWPELFQFLELSVRSEELPTREVLATSGCAELAVYLLSG